MSQSSAKLYQNLEKRLENLEDKVCGDESDTTKLMKSLKVVDQALTAFSSKRERFKQVFQKAQQIGETLRAGYEDELCGGGDDFKLSYVTARESEMGEICARLDDVDQLAAACLDADKGVDHIAAVSKHQDKLLALETVQQQQMEKAKSTSDDLHALLEAYNQIISTISNNFVQWDQQLTRLEAEKEAEKHQ